MLANTANTFTNAHQLLTCQASTSDSTMMVIQAEDLDIFTIIYGTAEGKKILQRTTQREESFISRAEREEIVRILVSHISSAVGCFYPSSQVKEAYAIALVQALPCLGIYGPGVSPHGHFYTAKLGRGFFETRLKSLRGRLKPINRKRNAYKTEKKKRLRVQKLKLPSYVLNIDMSEDEINSMKIKVSTLRNLRPVERNEATIVQ